MESTWKSRLEAADEARLHIIGRHMENGVSFPCVDGVLIEDTVVIGSGAVIEPGVILRGKTVIGENCLLTAGTRIEDCEIGAGCVVNASQCYASRIHGNVKIGPFAHIRPGSEILSGVKIGDFVEIKNARIGEYTAVAHLTYVGDSDVGSGVNFGCGCVTVNYDGKNKYRCVIGDRAFIGCNTNLVAPVTVGDDAFIAAGSTITDSLGDGDFAIARARQVVKPGLGAEKLKKQR